MTFYVSCSSSNFSNDHIGITSEGATKVNGVVLKGAIHHFRDDSFDETYGWEADVVAVKAINDSTKAIAKFAYFFGDNEGPISNDIKQFSLQLDYKF